MSVIDEAKVMLKDRLGVIDGERKQIERAMVELDGGSKPAGRRGRPPGKAKGTRKPRSGTRAEDAVALVASKPGITASNIAKALKIKPNYLYRVLGDLEKEGRVKKDGREYFPA